MHLLLAVLHSAPGRPLRGSAGGVRWTGGPPPKQTDRRQDDAWSHELGRSITVGGTAVTSLSGRTAPSLLGCCLAAAWVPLS